MRGLGGVCLVGLLAALGGTGCGNGQAAKGGKNPRVIIASPVTGTIMDYQDFTGRLEAVKAVEVRARVTGYVNEAPFKEGDLVKEGAVLFQIDPRPYQADLNQAKANLKVAIAERNLQEQNVERARRLVATKTLSSEEYQTIAAANEKAGATVGALQAAQEKAELYLDYTRVTAPVTGRISRRFVDPGNLINADNTVLTTIVTENPMYAYFDVDERTYLNLLASAAGGSSADVDKYHPPVMMRVANEHEFDVGKVGVVDFVDNRVVGNTGTVRMRGVFQNPGGFLKAGLFVRIRLPIGAAYRAILVPGEAVQSDQDRKYVWVVNAKSEVEYRSVQLGREIQELRGWQVIRPPEKGKEGKEGLTVGDRVIVSGMQRVRRGIAVQPEMQAPPPPPEMPLVRLLAEHDKLTGRGTGDRAQQPEGRNPKAEGKGQKAEVGGQ
jgi:RND family efflux transporter MFP subunit